MAADKGIEFYGDIDVAYVHADADGNTANAVMDSDSTFGLTHSHMVSEGVTAFAKVEFEFDADETTAGINQSDEIYVGVKGDFGSVQYGVDDTVYEWVDVTDTSEFVGLEGELAADSEVENLQDVSPEIADGLTVGVTLPVESSSVFAGALAAKYAMDNLELAFAYSMGREEAGVEAEDTIGLGATYSMDDITVMLGYESMSDTVDYIGLQGMYTMGQNQFALGYGMKSYDGAEDEATIALQALHNVTDHLFVALEYTTSTDLGGVDGADVDVLAIGANYSF